jgi:hypothetical protein
MKFNKLEILLEDIVDDVIKKYGNEDERGSFTYIRDHLIEKRFYYLDFIGKHLKEIDEAGFDNIFLVDVLNCFIRHKSQLVQKDLMKYEKFEDLFDVVQPYLEADREKKEMEENRKIQAKAANFSNLDPKIIKKVYEDDNYIVVLPLKYEGSKIMGNYCADKFKNTWCTVTAPEYWRNYTRKFMKQYYVLFKNFDEAMKKEYQGNHFGRMSVQVGRMGELIITPIENRRIPFYKPESEEILKLMGVKLDIFKKFGNLKDGLEREDVEILAEVFVGKNYTIRDDNVVDVKGYVDLKVANLYYLPFRFGKVDGDFDCGYNHLMSLDGCPEEVGYSFSCNNNDWLKTLEGGPKKVGLNYNCNYCKSLESLKGCAKEVGGKFQCNNCNLKSLEGSPEKVGDDFVCTNNHLKSLDGISRVIDGNSIFVYDNKIENKFTFKDLPEYVQFKGELIG